MNRCLRVAFFLALAAVSSPARAENWPQWRGPTRDGVSPETKLPASWSMEKNLAWHVPLPGMGSATPAVWGNRIFVPSEDEDDIVLVCLSTEGGKQLWKTKIGPGKQRFKADEGNQASPSPCTDGQHVYAFYGTGDFVCCDMKGDIIWRFNAQERYGKFKINHGIHCSPLLYEDRLYLSLLHSNAWWVIALDKSNGKELWKVRRESDGVAECKEAYASPVLWGKGKDAYLVILGCDYCTGHRLSDGGEIWRVGDLNIDPKRKYDKSFRIIATPAVSQEVIVVPSARNGPVVGVDPAAKGNFKTGSPFEKWRQNGGGPGSESKTPDVCAPLIHDGLVYICRQYDRETGALACLDANSGKELYYQEIHSARYRASPVYGDGKLYLAARDGWVTVIKAGPKFEKLAEIRMPDQFAASPAIADGRIYLRGFRELYAISEGGK